ncbi:AGAP007372-PA-like protein [Anopheles sinensis]|uniref:AGAP007372-PA-like protein n=1 Tax=Anopheles sinensis TaxID=74873 RepID=A0A084WN14_ANOSI|nr:AGAP007372-PA-like protein [Anopheles sinensis]
MMIVRFGAYVLVCFSSLSLVSQLHCLPLPGRLNPADVEAKIRDDHELLHTVTYVGNNKVPALVDQTPPKDYFGNDVKDEPLRRGIVGIVEQLSNVFNAIIEKVPKGAVTNLNKSVLDRLNQIGAVLVGLEDAEIK